MACSALDRVPQLNVLATEHVTIMRAALAGSLPNKTNHCLYNTGTVQLLALLDPLLSDKFGSPPPPPLSHKFHANLKIYIYIK